MAAALNISEPLDGETRYRRMMRRRFRNLFNALEDLIAYSSSTLRGWEQPEKPSQYQRALILLVVRARHAAAGVVVLAERGFGELAMGVCRLLAEAMVSAHWMSLDADERAAQFLRFGELEHLELGELLRDIGELTDEQLLAYHRDPERGAKLKDEFRDKSAGWMRRSMRKVIEDIVGCYWREREARTDFLKTMNILHLTGDRHSHVGASDTLNFLGEQGVSLGPTERAPTWGAQALKQAIICFLELFDLAVKEVKLTPLDAWNDYVRKTRARMSWLRKEQVGGVRPEQSCPCKSGLTYGTCHEDVDLLEMQR